MSEPEMFFELLNRDNIYSQYLQGIPLDTIASQVFCSNVYTKNGAKAYVQRVIIERELYNR